MGVLIAAAAVGLLVLGADPIAAWLLPRLPPPFGVLLLFAGVSLIAGLAMPPTRFLAQAAIVGILKAVLVLHRVSVQATLAAMRTVWTTGQTAWTRLWGRPTSWP
jgi:hypothetical protein